MKIALGQIDMGFENKEAAMALCSQLMAEAKEKAVDFVIFPEMTLTGFTLAPETYGEDRVNSPSINFFKEEAKKNAPPTTEQLLAQILEELKNKAEDIQPIENEEVSTTEELTPEQKEQQEQFLLAMCRKQFKSILIALKGRMDKGLTLGEILREDTLMSALEQGFDEILDIHG